MKYKVIAASLMLTTSIVVNAAPVKSIPYVSINPESVRNNINSDGAKGQNTIAIGTNAEALGIGDVVLGSTSKVNGGSSTAIGNRNTIKGIGSVAAGYDSHVNGNLSIAIGHKAKASESMNTAIGSAAHALGQSSTALGKGTLSEGKASTAVGAHALSGGHSSQAFGLHSQALGGQSTALGSNSIARGDQSTALGNAALSEGRFSIAIGNVAKAKYHGSVALGSGAETSDKVVGTTTATIGNTKLGAFAGNHPTAEVSVGKKGWERTVTNVGAGRISKTSTDAINGSQLHSLAVEVDKNAVKIDKLDKRVTSNAIQINTNAINIASNAKGVADNAKAIKDTQTEVAKQSERITNNTNAITKTNETVKVIQADVQKQAQINARQDKNIASNANGVASNAKQIKTNANNIASNSRGVAQNAKGIQTNAQQIKRVDERLDNVKAELKKGIAAAKTEVTAGENVTVNETKGTNGQSIYEVSVKDQWSKGIKENKNAIANNTTNITNNTKNIGKNAKDIADNAKKIAGNTDQLKQHEEKLNQGLNFVGDVGSTETKLGETLFVYGGAGNKVTAGGNISTKVSDGQIDIELVKDIDLGSEGSVTMGDVNISGYGINGGGKVIANIADGTDSRDAVNKGQLDKVAQQAKAAKTELKSGNNIVVDREVGKDGQSIYTVRTSRNVQFDQVLVGNVEITNQSGINAGNQTVKGVAKGEVSATSTEAVNGAQLHETNQRVNQNTVDIAGLRQLQNGFQADLGKLKRDFAAGTANAIAHANLPQAYAPGQSSVGVGVGHYRNEQAIAVGLSHVTDSGKWVVKGAASLDTRKKVGLGLGLAYVWGGRSALAAPVTHVHPVKEVVRTEVVVREVAPAPAKEKRIRQ